LNLLAFELAGNPDNCYRTEYLFQIFLAQISQPADLGFAASKLSIYWNANFMFAI